LVAMSETTTLRKYDKTDCVYFKQLYCHRTGKPCYFLPSCPGLTPADINKFPEIIKKVVATFIPTMKKLFRGLGQAFNRIADNMEPHD